MTTHSRALIDAISRLSRVQREVADRLSRELDCPRAALGLLWVLEKRGELTVGDIASHLRVDISVASRQTSALVDAGYAERTRQSTPGADHRVRTVRLSETGRSFTEQTRLRLDSMLAEIFHEWEPEQIRLAAAHISRVAETVGAFAEHTAPEPDTPALVGI
ncbi:MarR family winged helix-turn-helix transcriptional regulator [Cellulomonas sp. NPDC089187]|uniref:MarR family winged helix-turn-helix transcriptional regulator n=1 Tax=Cellulomonas sp. NPDC089187 TaxID=3154970 RepID=UPI00342DD60C